MGFSSDRGRTRLPIDHAARHPPDAISLAILANSQDTAVEQHGKKERERWQSTTWTAR
jgi:hypothetical protein